MSLENIKQKNNITLIGMSGVGKTTFGRELANRLNLDFIDVDILIKNQYKKPLPEIVKDLGVEDFQKTEERHILSLSKIENSLISPGGSVIYSERSMNLLSDISMIVFLFIDPHVLADRVGNKDRGIIGLENKTFEELYKERLPLYEKYSDLTIDINHKNLNMILEEIIFTYINHYNI